jgi:hypothetical protein
VTLSTISVHLDYTERCEVRTRLAARIARLLQPGAATCSRGRSGRWADMLVKH